MIGDRQLVRGDPQPWPGSPGGRGPSETTQYLVASVLRSILLNEFRAAVKPLDTKTPTDSANLVEDRHGADHDSQSVPGLGLLGKHCCTSTSGTSGFCVFLAKYFSPVLRRQRS